MRTSLREAQTKTFILPCCWQVVDIWIEQQLMEILRALLFNVIVFIIWHWCFSCFPCPDCKWNCFVNFIYLFKLLSRGEHPVNLGGRNGFLGGCHVVDVWALCGRLANSTGSSEWWCVQSICCNWFSKNWSIIWDIENRSIAVTLVLLVDFIAINPSLSSILFTSMHNS